MRAMARLALVVLASSLTIISGFSACKSDDSGNNKNKSDAGVLEQVPCQTAGGNCVDLKSCGAGTGFLGSEKYNCGTSRVVCCFDSCGSPENYECCNSDHTLAPRPVCADGKLACAAGLTMTAIGACLGDGGETDFPDATPPAEAGPDAATDASGDAPTDADDGAADAPTE
jgi:hypothetical protein